MAVQVVEGYYPAELINGAIFERFGFCRSFLNHPGGGYTFDFNAMVMWVDQDILLFQISGLRSICPICDCNLMTDLS